MDVRWQRRFAEAVEDFLEDALILELHNATAKIRMVGDHAAQFVAEVDFVARLGLLARLNQSFPAVGINAAQQENFHLAARLVTMTDKTGRHNAGIVEDKRIARFHIFLEVIEMTVFHSLFHRVKHHQTRGVTRFHRNLCNPFFWQFIIKIRK